MLHINIVHIITIHFLRNDTSIWGVTNKQGAQLF